MKFITTNEGKTLLMFNKYTYSLRRRTSNLYYCSRRGNALNCKSSAKLSEEGTVEFVIEKHNHRPPVFDVCGGIYVRVL